MSEGDVTQNPDGSVTLNRAGTWEMTSSPQPVPEVVSIDNIRDVVAHTEVIPTEHGDLIASPGQVWLMSEGELPSLTMEVELTEEQFWVLLDIMGGPEFAAEVRQDVNDVLRWEGEGGPCLH